MANNDTISDNGIYEYKPNQSATIVMAALFGVSAIYHLIVMIKKRTWFYIPLITGAIMMTVGYIARYISAKSPLELGPYIIQSLFIILPPSLYAATIYMIYGRIVNFVHSPDASMIRPDRVTKIFVFGDVISFFMQAGGGGMMAQPDMANLGQKIMLVGLFCQLLFFSLFLAISLVFWKRMQSSAKLYTTPAYGKHTWKSLMKLLFGAAVIIILRCVYRIVEFSQGNSGYLASHEIYMYIFDAVPMCIVQLMFHFVHAGNVFPSGLGESMQQDNGSWVALNERI